MIVNDYVCLNEIISVAQAEVQDEEQVSGLSMGWYRNMARKSLNEISYDTCFLKLHKDIENWKSEYPKRAIKFPAGSFNLRGIYLYNGDQFNIKSSTPVPYLHNYNPSAGGDGGTRRRRQNSNNIVHNSSRQEANYGSVIGYNVQNGMIVLTSACERIPNLRIEFNGIYGDIGEAPVVPRFFEDYVSSYLVERFYRRYRANGNAQRTAWGDSVNILEEARRKAVRRVKKMDSNTRREIENYYSRGKY